MPLEWIRLQLIPLPESAKPERILYWNPTTRDLVGAGADEVLSWLEAACAAGGITTQANAHFEITDPLSKPTELAAVLGLYYWVAPEPVASPAVLDASDLNTPQ